MQTNKISNNNICVGSSLRVCARHGHMNVVSAIASLATSISFSYSSNSVVGVRILAHAMLRALCLVHMGEQVNVCVYFSIIEIGNDTIQAYNTIWFVHGPCVLCCAVCKWIGIYLGATIVESRLKLFTLNAIIDRERESCVYTSCVEMLLMPIRSTLICMKVCGGSSVCSRTKHRSTRLSCRTKRETKRKPRNVLCWCIWSVRAIR